MIETIVTADHHKRELKMMTCAANIVFNKNYYMCILSTLYTLPRNCLFAVGGFKFIAPYPILFAISSTIC